MKKLWVLVVSGVFCAMMVGKSFALGVEAAGGGWYAALSGEAGYGGEELSVEDSLGMTDRKLAPYGYAKLDLPLINLYVAATPLKFEGKKTLDKTIQFGDYKFDLSSVINSELQLNQYDAGIYFGIPFLKMLTSLATLGLGGLDLNFGVNLRLIDLYAKVEGKVSGGTKTEVEKGDKTIPVPMLYLGLNVKVWKLSLEGEGRGIAYGGQSFYDLIGRTRFPLIGVPLGPKFFVEAGYRYQKLEIDTEVKGKDLKGSLTISGPFVGVGGEFSLF